MQNDDYINSLHRKIRYKKIQNNVIGSVGSLAIIVSVFFTFNAPVEDLHFDQYYDSLSVEEFTLFIMEEANLWDTEDLIYFNDLYENTNEYEASL